MESNIKGIVGMIIPPPEMRAVIDRTAEFVSKQGPEMEKKIYSSDPTHIRFAFIAKDNPFHPYYTFAIQCYKEGRTPEIPKSTTRMQEEEEPIVEEKKAVAAASESTVERKAKYDPLTSVYRNIPDEEPPAYAFSSTLPELYSLDLDVLRLTAQYTAVNGRKFLENIMSYQSHNPQFDFLKPTHMLNGFFTSLVEQYSKVLHFDTDIKEPLLRKYKNRETSLQLSAHRLEWAHREEMEKRRQQAMNDDDELMHKIDWNDFAVVETITFEDNAMLPNAERLGGAWQMEVDMEMDDDVPPAPAPAPAPVPTPTPTIPPAPAMPAIPAMPAVPTPAIPDASTLKIVSEYQPRLKTTAQTTAQTMVDPLTNRVIPVDQANEHLRIELIDPMWKKQTEVRKARDATTNLVDGSAITDTIHRMRAQKDEELQVKRVAALREQTDDGEEADAAADEAFKRMKMKAMGISPATGSATATGITSTPAAPPMAAPTMPAPRPAFPGMTASPPPPSSAVSAAPTAPTLPAAATPRPTPPMNMPAMPAMPAMPSLPGMGGLPGMPNILGLPNLPNLPNMPNMPNMPASLIPEQQWIASNPGPITLQVKLPVDSSNPAWNLNGQVISVTIDIGATIKMVKQQIGSIQGNMPESKQQLKHAKHGFLKDAQTLGYYNLSSGTELQLTVRSRGGRK